MELSSYFPLVSAYLPQILALIAGFVLFRVIKALLSSRSSSKQHQYGYNNGRGDSDVYETMSENELNVTIADNNVNKLRQDVPYERTAYDEKEMIRRSNEFYVNIDRRRSVRHFSDKSVPIEVIENLVKAAGTSPSGANLQPWTFVIVQDQDVKSCIKQIVEDEEMLNYRQRMGDKWVNDLKHIKTTWQKAYLEIAPYLIMVFEQVYGVREDGTKQSNYYSRISTSISCGLLLAAIQNAGLCTVTSTPLNAGPALRQLLQRPSNEKLLLLLPVGYPADNATIPDIKRKSLDDIMIVI